MIFVFKPSGHRTPGEYLQGTVTRETRRTPGPGSGKRRRRYRWTAGPPLRGGADALRTTRPEVGIAKSDDRVTCRNGFVADLDVTHGNATEITACGRA